MSTFSTASTVESEGKRLRFRFRVEQVIESTLIIGTQFSTDGVNWGEACTWQVEIPWPQKTKQKPKDSPENGESQ